jgi:hypothetical protein
MMGTSPKNCPFRLTGGVFSDSQPEVGSGLDQAHQLLGLDLREERYRGEIGERDHRRM